MTEPIKFDTVLDTGAEQLGRTYATALLGAASRGAAVEAVLDDLRMVVDEALVGNQRLAAALQSPQISAEEKMRVLDRVFGDTIHSLLLRFLKVMAQRQRLYYLPAIRRAAEELYDEHLGRVVAEVRTAVPLDDAMRNQVTERLEGVLAKRVRLIEVVDETVLGGLVVRVGDTVFDGSVSGQLTAMTRETRRGIARRLLASADSFASGEIAGA